MKVLAHCLPYSDVLIPKLFYHTDSSSPSCTGSSPSPPGTGRIPPEKQEPVGDTYEEGPQKTGIIF